ncbi:hypothetical protein WG68_02850 [Arsukibacterium ikkense]|uniref:Uncharacterized protein n=1 Tax=Arsukibacterium ikkense TaxID=336831 RepID=A0A0M2VCP5_9GAMM|nr:hypothetical protein [Arsukibacterium ikkense]KKO46893.1 hypothetical protein WG68_02850 [Arsukibacterium ikkense]
MSYKGLLVTGGCLRPDGFELGEGKYYGKAGLLKLDLSSGEFTPLLTKADGGTNYPPQHPNQQFTAACLDGDTLWLPTDTEVYQYQLPELKQLKCFSHPCFHNIHSVHLFDNELIVTSTGLDNIVVLCPQSGEIKRIINTEGKAPWHRFDAGTDYRLVHSTRPHDSHPNYVFKLDNKLWVTRCTHDDAVCLDDVTDRIDVAHQDEMSVHDGIWWHDKLVFTRVDGYLVIVDPTSRKVIDKHDPFASERNRPLGWCRGLLVDGDIFYIGYSKLRKTKLISKLKFLTQGNFKYMDGNEALIVAYDMAAKKVVNTYAIPAGMLDAIYGILPYNYA